MKCSSRAGAVFDAILNGLAMVSAVLVVSLMLITCVDLTMRYGFAHGIKGLIEIRGYALLFMVFLGSAWVLKREAHVNVDIVVAHLSIRVQAILKVITSAVAAAACLAVAWYGLELTLRLIRDGSRIMSILRPIEWPFKAVVPVSFTCLTIQFIRRAVAAARSMRGAGT